MRILALVAISFALVAAASPEQTRREAQAARVTITRDDWGIAHVRGRSDADAVFGAIYAQAEDDFPRVEANLLTALGRTAEADGESALWQDLRQRLWIDPAALQADYRSSPAWLRALMDAWADGLNHYLATHPEVRPRVLTRFEPWMALSFTEGSIGGDIERADLTQLAAFYGERHVALAAPDEEPRGSNGIAIAPPLARDGRALLLINPHTSFFFRSELGMESDEGLHAYGASTWGQFFIYQGFNERVGWMHTSSGVDSVDEFAEDIARGRGGPYYRYGRALRPVRSVPVTIRIRRPDGSFASRTFTTYRTHHGPIVRAEGERWIALALMHRPVPALQQSWLRTKARDYAGFMRAAALQANSSNDTIYADADGHIAYLHPQFVPVRDDRFDYRDPVPGSDPATDWRGLTPLAALPQVRDPLTHWLYNANDAPWRAAGADSPRQDAFPRYMDTAGANPRGDHAIGLLGEARALTPEGLRAIAYSPLMPFFDAASLPLDDLEAEWSRSRRTLVAQGQALLTLKRWDRRWAADSQATTLANFWGEELWTLAGRVRPRHGNMWEAMRRLSPADRLDALERARVRLEREWGPRIPAWGEVNRFQRNDAAITQTFDDARPSIPVPFVSGRWGSLASFGARAYPGTRRWYGTNGNSFVAIVEFGPRTRAWAVTAGGESGNPSSPHFNDQAERYASGNLRPVYFYREDLEGHIARTYHPGAR
jgi:acyl-homoserine-lactone acylase